ncbi:Uncharacterized protein PBTT_06304 [Plasmodiophora brassicae]
MASSRKLAFLTGVVVLAGVMGSAPVKMATVPVPGQASRLKLAGMVGVGTAFGLIERTGRCLEELRKQGFYDQVSSLPFCARDTFRTFLSSATIPAGGYLVARRLTAMTRSRIMGFLAGYAAAYVVFNLRQRLMPAKYAFEKQVLAFGQAPTLEKLSDIIESFGAASGHDDWINLLELNNKMYVFLNKFGCSLPRDFFATKAELESCKARVKEEYSSTELTDTQFALYVQFLSKMDVLIRKYTQM